MERSPSSSQDLPMAPRWQSELGRSSEPRLPILLPRAGSFVGHFTHAATPSSHGSRSHRVPSGMAQNTARSQTAERCQDIEAPSLGITPDAIDLVTPQLSTMPKRRTLVENAVFEVAVPTQQWKAHHLSPLRGTSTSLTLASPLLVEPSRASNTDGA